MKRWFYLSFADENGWLGGAVIEAHDVFDATVELWRQGINPGGEVVAVTIPPSMCPPPPGSQGKLLTREDLGRYFGATDNLGAN